MIDEQVALILAVLAVLPILLISVFALFGGRKTREEGPPRKESPAKAAAPRKESRKETVGSGR